MPENVILFKPGISDMQEAPTAPAGEIPPSPFLARLGACIVMWNMAERSVRLLLASMARESIHPIDPKGEILTMELGSRQVSEALHAFAHEVLEGEQAEAVRYIALYFERLLAYRNHYVHGVVSVHPSTSPPGEAGAIQSVSAKGKLMQTNEWLRAEQLDQFFEWAAHLNNYASGVTFHMFFTLGPQVPLPEKPPLPATLARRRLSLHELRRPHPRSRQ